MNISNEDNKADSTRAQVGIGTLIVFIAMVLVAAIAAGVLINTAGFLQTQAEDTGTESTEQVADNLNVITEVGDVADRDDTTTADKIDRIRVGLQPAAGSDDINLAELTVQYVSDGDFANLVVGVDGNDAASGSQAGGDTNPDNIVISSSGNANGADAEYAVDVITAENEDDIVMTDGADRYELVIPLVDDNDDSGISSKFDSITANSDVSSDLNPLDEGEQVELTITTEVGAQSIAFLQVPDSLSGDDSGSTVNL